MQKASNVCICMEINNEKSTLLWNMTVFVSRMELGGEKEGPAPFVGRVIGQNILVFGAFLYHQGCHLS
jgi:hypothetical protein